VDIALAAGIGAGGESVTGGSLSDRMLNKRPVAG
jgi:hypothetical protein